MAKAVVAGKPGEKQGRGKRPRRRLFNVDEYYRMAEAGIFGPDERVELIDGAIIEMAAMGSRHATRVRRLTRWWVLHLNDRAVVSTQCPLRLSSMSEPEPDIALLRPRADEYASTHPQAEDVLLLIEVADTSLAFDRRTKLPIYAEEGIVEFWLVDLNGGRVDVYRRPEHGHYQDVDTLTRGASVSPLALPDLRISVAEILG